MFKITYNHKKSWLMSKLSIPTAFQGTLNSCSVTSFAIESSDAFWKMIHKKRGLLVCSLTIHHRFAWPAQERVNLAKRLKCCVKCYNSSLYEWRTWNGQVKDVYLAAVKNDEWCYPLPWAVSFLGQESFLQRSTQQKSHEQNGFCSYYATIIRVRSCDALLEEAASEMLW